MGIKAPASSSVVARPIISIDDAVVKLDGEGRFAAINQAAADIYQRLGLKFFV